MRRAVVMGFGLLAVWSAAGRAQQTVADSIVAACVATDTASAWQRYSMDWSMERPGSWTNDSLRLVLIELADADQSMRPAAALSDSIKDPGFRQRLAELDSTHAVQLRRIIKKFGWPTRTLVGARGASAAFLIAQHNESIHAEALRLMRALPPGEVQAAAMAMLEDRVLAIGGRPQKYGTQLKPGDSELEFYPIDSIARLDARRAEVGLPPMSVYLCMMKGFTGRTVKFPP